MVKDNDLTFVVQGPVVDCTDAVLQSINHHFPNSPIILSTWEQSNTEHLSTPHVLVENKDPGGFKVGSVRDKSENINRLLHSSKKGLSEVNTPYAVKTRSDTFLENSRLLQHLPNLGDKVLQTDIVVGHPFTSPFHPSDTFLSAKTEVLLKYFSPPPATIEQMKLLAPEQYIGSHFQAISPISEQLNSMNAFLQGSMEEIEETRSFMKNSLHFLIDQFSIVPAEDLGVKHPDRIKPATRISEITKLANLVTSNPKRLDTFLLKCLQWNFIEQDHKTKKGIPRKLAKIKRSLFKRRYFTNGELTLDRF